MQPQTARQVAPEVSRMHIEKGREVFPCDVQQHIFAGGRTEAEAGVAAGGGGPQCQEGRHAAGAGVEDRGLGVRRPIGGAGAQRPCAADHPPPARERGGEAVVSSLFQGTALAAVSPVVGNLLGRQGVRRGPSGRGVNETEFVAPAMEMYSMKRTSYMLHML